MNNSSKFHIKDYKLYVEIDGMEFIFRDITPNDCRKLEEFRDNLTLENIQEILSWIILKGSIEELTLRQFAELYSIVVEEILKFSIPWENFLQTCFILGKKSFIMYPHLVDSPVTLITEMANTAEEIYRKEKEYLDSIK